MPENNVEKKETNIKKEAILITIGMLFLLAILLVFVSRNNNGIPERTYSDGYITVASRSSASYPSLFISENGKYMIDIEGLDKLTSLDSVKTPEGYVINNVFDQIFIKPRDTSYSINSNTISDDDNYTPPIVDGEKVYGDTDQILIGLGYSTEYKTSADGSVIELILTNTDKNSYMLIETNEKIEEDDEIAEMPQVEEGAINPGDNSPNRPQDELTTVPRPDRETESSSESKSWQSASELNETSENTENEENIEESVESTESETEDISETPEVVEPLPYNPNKKTDAEFQQMWEEDKSVLENVYSNSNSNFGQDSFAELSENTIVFNEATGTVYSNTVTVSHDTLSGEFIVVSFNGDWSDQAVNVSSEVSKAYYAGIPEVVRQTLVTVLGPNAGTELFNYIKAHADMTITGGYIATTNPETGALESVWTDGEVGNGMNADTLNFESWQNRISDDGLRFDVVRDGNGIKVLVYKD